MLRHRLAKTDPIDQETAMKFLMTYAATQNVPPTPEQMAEIGRFSQEMMASGVLLMTGGLVRPSKGTRIQLSGGKFTVTDGPYPETKELIDGFALIEVGSRQEALDLAKRFMSIAGEGEGEVLQVFDPPGVPR
jgi:hypothetical protein